jgi:hypothetical protein
MRQVALVLAAAGLVAGLAFAFTAGGHAGARPDLDAAAARTATAASARWVIHVRMTHAGEPVSLHIRGQSGPHMLSVKMRLGDSVLADGTKVPGMNGAALLDGPYLYERAPGALALYGAIRWLRLRVGSLPAGGNDLDAVRSLSPVPLLRVLRHARLARLRPGSRSFHGTLAYDDPSVRAGLAKLTGGLEFRGLRISGLVGRDGLVHRVVLTGRTADGKTTLSLRAHLFAFGTRFHVKPPPPGTFIDDQAGIAA